MPEERIAGAGFPYDGTREATRGHITASVRAVPLAIQALSDECEQEEESKSERFVSRKEQQEGSVDHHYNFGFTAFGTLLGRC